MTAKTYRRGKRRTRRQSYRREDISRIVDSVLKSRQQISGRTPKTSRRARPSIVAFPEQSPSSASREPALFDPHQPEAERIVDFARLLGFVRQEAALILDDGYCEDLLTRCIDRLNQKYQLAQWEPFGSGPNKSVH